MKTYILEIQVNFLSLEVLNRGSETQLYVIENLNLWFSGLTGGGVAFSRQNLTSVDVRLSEVDPHTVSVKIFITLVDPQRGIQMNRKELTKTL